MHKIATMAFAVAAIVTAAAPARADLFRDIGLGLYYAGFNVEGDRNILSGGADLLINRNLVGNPLDVGPADLTLTGPVSLSASYGTRFIDTFDLSLRTALDADSAAFPLNYEFNADPGSQVTQVTGSLFVDANLSINEFGFYDIDLAYSSRQDVENLGRFGNDSDQNDYDIGPISVSGNIYADVLGVLTDPLFQAAGTVNIFKSFSGSGSISRLLDLQRFDLLDQLAAGLGTDGGLLGGSEAKLFGELGGSYAAPEASGEAGDAISGGVIPEPAVLFLLLVGAPFLFRQRLRRCRTIGGCRIPVPDKSTR